MKFSIIIPVHNEKDNIVTLLKDIKRVFENNNTYQFEVIIVDDKSNVPLEIRNNEILNFFDISIYRHSENHGQSAAIYTGVIKSKYPIILTLDADGQNDPNDMITLLEEKDHKSVNLVQGIRVNRKDNFSKRISSKIANYLRSSILGDNCSDSGCSFRVFDKSNFKKINYFDHMHRFMPYLFLVHNYTISYVNVTHRKRLHGQSNYNNINRFISGIIDILGLLWVKKRMYSVKDVDKTK